MKKILALLVGLLIVAGVLFGGGLILFSSLNRAGEKSATESHRFIVEPGKSLQTIAFELEREGFIRSGLFFRLLGRVKKMENRVKAGVYEIPPESTSLEIFNLLVSGKQQLIKVTIPEGHTLRKIAEILETRGIVSAEEFISVAEQEELLNELSIPGNTLEGFLFPDTYFFPPEYESKRVITHLTDNFFKNLEKIYPNWRELEPAELERKIILASIVEREYRLPQEAPLIASVFYNRLKVNMGLNSCATIEYIITEIEGKDHPEFLSYEDLEIDSPFNTYKWAGLPPHPICCPGAVAIKASFYPENTDFFYFVLKDPATGEHHFSESNIEHIEAKRMYLKD